MLPSALPYSESDLVGLALDQPDVHVDMADILGQSAAGTLDGDETRFNGDLNTGA